MSGYTDPNTIQDAATNAPLQAALLDQFRTNDEWLARNRPHVRCIRSANFTHNSTGNWVAVPFTAESYDVGGLHDNASNTTRITIAADCEGKFVFRGGGSWFTNGAGRRLFRIRKNGTTVVAQVELGISSNESGGIVPTDPIAVVVGDYLELEAFQSSGGNLDIVFASDYSPTFSAFWSVL